jgi:hypothetical protein
MKYLARLYTLIVILVFAFSAHAVFADSSTSVTISNNGANSQNDVQVQTNTGGNTICQNGTCTTTSGDNGQSTVCINGKCTTSRGNIDMQSEDGHDQVNIRNDTDNAVSVTVAPSPSVDVSPDVSISPAPSLTPDPTITQMRRTVRKQIKKQVQELKEHLKDQSGAISSFVQSELQSLQDMLQVMFK